MKTCYKCKEKYKNRKDGCCPNCGTPVNMKGGKTNVCPECGGHFTNKNKDKCPHCDVKLKLVEDKGNVKSFHYEAVKETYNEPPPPPKDIEVNKIKDDYYEVVFRVWTQRAVCPTCKLMAFKPRLANGDVEHKCNRCKTITMFKFRLFNRGVVRSNLQSPQGRTI